MDCFIGFCNSKRPKSHSLNFSMELRHGCIPWKLELFGGQRPVDVARRDRAGLSRCSPDSPSCVARPLRMNSALWRSTFPGLCAGREAQRGGLAFCLVSEHERCACSWVTGRAAQLGSNGNFSALFHQSWWLCVCVKYREKTQEINSALCDLNWYWWQFKSDYKGIWWHKCDIGLVLRIPLCFWLKLDLRVLSWTPTSRAIGHMRLWHPRHGQLFVIWCHPAWLLSSAPNRSCLVFDRL